MPARLGSQRGDTIERPGHRTLIATHLMPLASMLVLGLLAYANSFQAGFAFDDVSELQENEAIRQLGDWRQLASLQPTRFVTYLSFALNYHFGQQEVFGYHLVNLLIHLCNALLVYALIVAAFRTPALERSPLGAHAREVAFVASVLFATHPLQTQAVTYIVQRLASLTTFFYLLTVVLFALYRRLSFDGVALGKRLALYVAMLASGFLAMKTKESAFTLPLAICGFDLLFYSSAVHRRVLYLLPVLALLAVIPLSRIRLGSGDLAAQLQGASALESPLSRGEYLLTELPVVVTYLRLLVFPAGQNLDHDVPTYGSLFHPAVALSAVLLLGLMGLAAYLWRRSVVRPETDPAGRLVAFGIFWFFLALAVESSVIPIADVMFEHRVYLPSFGFFLIVATGVVLAARRAWPAHTGSAAIIAGVVLGSVLAVATFQRNKVWRDDLSLWSDAVAKAPGKARPHQYLALALFRREELDRAIEEYAIAVKLDPSYAEPHVNFGVALFKKGLVDEAIEQFRHAIALRPDYPEAHYNLGIAYGRKGLRELAFEEMSKGMKK